MRDLIILEAIDSTQLEAKRFLDAKPDISCLSIVAKKMTNGLTRKKDCKWEAPLGNLYLSHIMNIDGYTTKQINFLVACFSLGVIDFINSIATKDLIPILRLKWPNDILINGSKVCGILCEVYKSCIIVGIGLNLVTHPSKTNNFPATNLLSELKTNFNTDIKYITESILYNSSRYIDLIKSDNIDILKSKWKSLAFKLNQTVYLTGINKDMLFLDIGDNFEMIVKDEATGVISSIVSNDYT